MRIVPRGLPLQSSLLRRRLMGMPRASETYLPARQLARHCRQRAGPKRFHEDLCSELDSAVCDGYVYKVGSRPGGLVARVLSLVFTWMPFVLYKYGAKIRSIISTKQETADRAWREVDSKHSMHLQNDRRPLYLGSTRSESCSHGSFKESAKCCTYTEHIAGMVKYCA